MAIRAAETGFGFAALESVVVTVTEGGEWRSEAYKSVLCIAQVLRHLHSFCFPEIIVVPCT